MNVSIPLWNCYVAANNTFCFRNKFPGKLSPQIFLLIKRRFRRENNKIDGKCFFIFECGIIV